MQPKSTVDIKWALDPLKSKSFKPSGKRFHLIHGHNYDYDIPTKRHVLRYVFLGAALLLICLWFVLESIRGWDLFQP